MIGETLTITSEVGHEQLACTVGSGDLLVLATPMMVAKMEEAASTLLARFLEPGQTSVGTAVNIAHTSATPLGMQISVTASITAQDGRSVSFDVSAADECGEIGKGTHQRFIVMADKFQAKTDAKRQGA